MARTDHKSRSRLPRLAWAGLVIGTLVVVVAALSDGLDDVLAALRTASPTYLALAVVLSLAAIGFRFGRWQYMMSLVSPGISRLTSLLIYCSGLAMVLTPARFGEVIRFSLLERAGGAPAAETAPVLLTERFSEGLGLIAVASAAAGAIILSHPVRPLHPLAFPAIGVTFGLVVLSMAALKQPWGERLSLWAADRIPPLGRRKPAIEQFWGSMTSLLGGNVLVPTTALTIGGWLCQGLAMFFIVLAIGRTISIGQALLIPALASVIGTVSLIPAGLGVADGGVFLLLRQTGLSSARAVATVVVWRALSLWLPLMLGGAAMVLSSYGTKRSGGTKGWH